MDQVSVKYQGLVLAPLPLAENEHLETGHEAIEEKLIEFARERYREKAGNLGPDLTRKLEKFVLIQILDQHWRDHLNEFDPVAQRHRPAVLRAAQPADRIQVGVLPDVRAARGGHRAGRRSTCSSGRSWRRRRSRRPEQDVSQVEDTPFVGVGLRGRAGPAPAGDPGGDQRSGRGQGTAHRAGGTQGRPERSLPVRQRQEVQEMLRGELIAPRLRPSLLREPGRARFLAAGIGRRLRVAAGAHHVSARLNIAWIQKRNRLKHLLVILLEALSDADGPSRSRIQEKVASAGLDETDVNGLLDWIESQWQPFAHRRLLCRSLAGGPVGPIVPAFRRPRPGLPDRIGHGLFAGTASRRDRSVALRWRL